jgi:hypothetical protein
MLNGRKMSWAQQRDAPMKEVTVIKSVTAYSLDASALVKRYAVETESIWMSRSWRGKANTRSGERT